MSKNRREFLRNLGLGAAAGIVAPWVPLLEREALAAGEAPRRLVLFITGNGSYYNAWKPTGTETNFTLSPILSALEPFKSKLNICDGINQPVFNTGPGKPHPRAQVQLLTGRAMTSEEGASSSGGISVDQYIANQVGAQSVFPSLQLGVQSAVKYSYAGPGQGLSSAVSPIQQFDRIFGNFNGDGTAPDPDLVRRHQIRTQTFALVQEQLGRVKSKLSAHDAERIAAHQDKLGVLKTRLDDLQQLGGSCEKPNPNFSAVSGQDLSSSQMYPHVSDLQIDIGAATLACDLTRVMTITHGNSGNTQLQPVWLNYQGQPITDVHHELGHASRKEAPAQGKITEIEKYHARQFARLLAAMDAVQEGERTLLDNSIVVWMNPMATGSHTMENMPYVIAGSGGGALQTGRYLRFGGKSNNDFLLSLAHLMGVTGSNTFGDPAFSDGPLSQLV